MEIKISSNGLWKYGLKYFTWPWEVLKAIGHGLKNNPDAIFDCGMVLFFAIAIAGLIMTGVSIYQRWILLAILTPLTSGALMWAVGDMIDYLVELCK